MFRQKPSNDQAKKVATKSPHEKYRDDVYRYVIAPRTAGVRWEYCRLSYQSVHKALVHLHVAASGGSVLTFDLRTQKQSAEDTFLQAMRELGQAGWEVCGSNLFAPGQKNAMATVMTGLDQTGFMTGFVFKFDMYFKRKLE